MTGGECETVAASLLDEPSAKVASDQLTSQCDVAARGQVAHTDGTVLRQWGQRFRFPPKPDQ